MESGLQAGGRRFEPGHVHNSWHSLLSLVLLIVSFFWCCEANAIGTAFDFVLASPLTLRRRISAKDVGEQLPRVLGTFRERHRCENWKMKGRPDEDIASPRCGRCVLCAWPWRWLQ